MRAERRRGDEHGATAVTGSASRSSGSRAAVCCSSSIYGVKHPPCATWLALHPPPRGADSPCAATSATLDYPAERCLPYIFPLKSVADECADAPAYDYPELPEWVELGRGK